MSLHVPSGIIHAHEQWGANCGPTAFGAICGIGRMNAVQKFFPHFPKRKYTTIADMEDALCRAGQTVTKIDRVWPKHGVALVQWAVPGRGYSMRYSHWVAAEMWKPVDGDARLMVFDHNFMGLHDRGAWGELHEWEDLAQEIMAQYQALGYRIFLSFEVQ